MKRKANFLEKIGSLIPGYRGYADRDARRNCDKMMRNSISQKLQVFEKEMNTWALDAFKNKEKEKMNEVERVRKDINTLKSRVEYAPYGATSFFADRQIKEDELFEIYQFDHDLLDVSNKITSCKLSDLKNLAEHVSQCSNILDKRIDYIAQF